MEHNSEQLILLVAERLFMEQGYALTRTTQIAQEAGVTHAMVNYYFRSKERIFQRIFEEKAKQLAISMLSVFDTDLPFFQRIASAVESHFDFISHQPRLPLFIINEVLHNPTHAMLVRDNAQPVAQQVVYKLGTMIDEAVDQGIIDPIAPLHLIYSIVSLNISAFMVLPAFRTIVESSYEEEQRFLKERKKENVKTIIARLQCRTL